MNKKTIVLLLVALFLSINTKSQSNSKVPKYATKVYDTFNNFTQEDTSVCQGTSSTILKAKVMRDNGQNNIPITQGYIEFFIDTDANSNNTHSIGTSTLNSLGIGQITYNLSSLPTGVHTKYYVRYYGTYQYADYSTSFSKITINSTPSISNYSATSCLGSEVIYGASFTGNQDNDNYSWLYSGTLNTDYTLNNGCDNQNVTRVTWKTPGMKTVTLKNSSGCSNSKQTNVILTTNPVVDSTQSFCDHALISNLTASGTNIKWYKTLTSNSVLHNTDSLINNNNYYTTQTSSGCESDRAKVKVRIRPSEASMIIIFADDMCNTSYTAFSTASSTMFNWKVNGSNIGGNDNHLSYSLDGDSLSCTVTSDDYCLIGQTTSNIIVTSHIKNLVWLGVTDNNWDTPSNWSCNRIPTYKDSVSIPSNLATPYSPTIYSLSEVKYLKIDSLGKVTISNSGKLTVYDNLTNNSDSGIIVRSDAAGTGSFINYGNISGSGNFKCEQYLTQIQNGGVRYNYISYPLTTTFTNVYYMYYMYYLEEPTNTFKNMYINNTMDRMRGYVVYKPGIVTDTKVFVGKVNSGIIGAANNITCADATKGWNLMGNPYPSAIDWDAQDGWVKTNIYDAIYMWNQKTKSYATYVSGIGLNGATNIIPSMCGFMVKVYTDQHFGTLQVNNLARVHSNSPVLIEKSKPKNSLKLTVSGLQSSDETVIIFGDKPINTPKLFSEESPTQIYAHKNGDFAIYTVSENKSDTTVPICVKVLKNGLYELKIDNNLSATHQLTIYDIKLKKYFKTNTYTFFADENSTYNFTLSFVDNFKIEQSSINTNEYIEYVEIYTLSGQLISKFNCLSYDNFPIGNYIKKTVTNKSVKSEIIFNTK